VSFINQTQTCHEPIGSGTERVYTFFLGLLILRVCNCILDPRGYFFLLLTNRFCFLFIYLIFKCIYNVLSIQSYIHLYIETRGLVSITGGGSVYLSTGSRLDVRIIPSQVHLRKRQGLNRVERSLIAKLCTNLLIIYYLTGQTYAGSK
jgi:hypothetical protein